jgi:Cu-Zn family superoxide dismutase
MGQRATIALLTVAGVLGATGTALADPPPPATSSVTFQRYVPGAAGITYDTDALPIGSHAAVLSVPDRHGTTTILWLHGLLPNHAYGAHVHQNPCGADADAAGPHFQHTPDPVQPSVDPQYANPHNEIWLDLTTDAMGNATSAPIPDTPGRPDHDWPASRSPSDRRPALCRYFGVRAYGPLEPIAWPSPDRVNEVSG